MKIEEIRELFQQKKLTDEDIQAVEGTIQREMEARRGLDEFREVEAMYLSFSLQIWDQTVGCEHCGRAWWGDEYTDDPTMFHTEECPLLGRRDVAVHWFDMDYVEKGLGRRCGH